MVDRQRLLRGAGVSAAGLVAGLVVAAAYVAVRDAPADTDLTAGLIVVVGAVCGLLGGAWVATANAAHRLVQAVAAIVVNWLVVSVIGVVVLLALPGSGFAGAELALWGAPVALLIGGAGAAAAGLLRRG